MSYATPTDFLNRVDARRLGDLGLDDGTRVDPVGLLTNDRLQASLDDGAGLIDAAVMAGDRYTVLDLTTILAAATAADPLWNSRGLLIRLNVQLAFGLLREARGYEAEPAYEQALQMVDQLRAGNWIFALPAQKAAGLTVIDDISLKRNTLVAEARAYFGNLDYTRQ